MGLLAGSSLRSSTAPTPTSSPSLSPPRSSFLFARRSLHLRPAFLIPDGCQTPPPLPRSSWALPSQLILCFLIWRMGEFPLFCFPTPKGPWFLNGLPFLLPSHRSPLPGLPGRGCSGDKAHPPPPTPASGRGRSRES